jgi:Domain of unknown function (DUF4394)
MTKLTRWVIVLGAMLALVVPLGAAADNGGSKNDRRVLFATDTAFTAFATRPTVTELYALDIAPSNDQLWIQRPANNGTLIMPVSLDFDLGSNAGFDIVGSDATGNIGYVAGTDAGRSSAELWRVDLATGETRSLGRIGKGVTITGLAAWQDQ